MNKDSVAVIPDCKKLKFSFDDFKENIMLALEAYREAYENKEPTLLLVALATKNEDGTYNTSTGVVPCNAKFEEITFTEQSNEFIKSLTINKK
jgi:hypothetical protein